MHMQIAGTYFVTENDRPSTLKATTWHPVALLLTVINHAIAQSAAADGGIL